MCTYLLSYILTHLLTAPGPTRLKPGGVPGEYVGKFHLLQHGTHVVLPMPCAVWPIM